MNTSTAWGVVAGAGHEVPGLQVTQLFDGRQHTRILVEKRLEVIRVVNHVVALRDVADDAG